VKCISKILEEIQFVLAIGGISIAIFKIKVLYHEGRVNVYSFRSFYVIYKGYLVHIFHKSFIKNKKITGFQINLKSTVGSLEAMV